MIEVYDQERPEVEWPLPGSISSDAGEVVADRPCRGTRWPSSSRPSSGRRELVDERQPDRRDAELAHREEAGRRRISHCGPLPDGRRLASPLGVGHDRRTPGRRRRRPAPILAAEVRRKRVRSRLVQRMPRRSGRSVKMKTALSRLEERRGDRHAERSDSVFSNSAKRFRRPSGLLEGHPEDDRGQIERIRITSDPLPLHPRAVPGQGGPNRVVPFGGIIGRGRILEDRAQTIQKSGQSPGDRHGSDAEYVRPTPEGRTTGLPNRRRFERRAPDVGHPEETIVGEAGQ